MSLKDKKRLIEAGSSSISFCFGNKNINLKSSSKAFY